ncbi:MAG: tetraacyldisaccharide 4'-kinase [Proteobacteria bacterium]|nr:tetraacyldisaccharide 4'-kinase [Pseudomonadota bacterium]
MKIREKLYKQGLFRRNSLPIPVISVGNLVLGGTGKTPTVHYLAKLLLQQGYHPAIISRGYGGKAKQKVNVVSDGNTLYLTPEQAGDEPYMLAEELPGVPVLTGKRRLSPCLLAIEDFNVDVLILDDGFQHLAIKRDIDIVLFDGTVLAGNKRIFPGGILREPLSALHRCDAFVITGINEKNKEQAEEFGTYLRNLFTTKPVYFASLDMHKLQCPDLRNEISSSGGPFFAFCGIANPSRFQESLNAMAIQLSGFLALPDHVHYNQDMMIDICKQAIASGARQLVTTKKDFVKIKDFDSTLLRHVMEIHFQTEKSFDLFITKSMQKKNICPSNFT